MAFAEKIIFLYLVLFPFGQLFKMKVLFIDLAVFLSMLFLIFKKIKINKIFLGFIATVLFSFLLSLTIFDIRQVLIGFLYLLRLIAYFSFFSTVSYFSKKTKKNNLLFNSLILVSFLVNVFGWYQYLFYPDLRWLKQLGWDDHFGRLVGTFLDPGFTSIILVFGFLLSINKFFANKQKVYLLISIFQVVSVAFTYSRAGYLAFIGGLATFLFLKKRLIFFPIIVFASYMFLFFLPRFPSEGTRLFRTKSLLARVQNYQETLEIFKRNPLFGVGFNNLCIARQEILVIDKFGSHSCSGSDSSLLFLLATTGTTGFFIFLNILYQITKRVKFDIYGISFLSCLAALSLNSLFINSMFYPFIMGYMAILAIIALKDKTLL